MALRTSRVVDNRTNQIPSWFADLCRLTFNLLDCPTVALSHYSFHTHHSKLILLSTMLQRPVGTRKRDKLRGLLQPNQPAAFQRNSQPTLSAASTVAQIQGLAPSSTSPPPLAVPPATSSTSRVEVATPIAAPSEAAQPDPSISTPPDRDLWLDALQTLTEAEQNAVRNIQPMGPARRYWSETLEELVWLTKEKQKECENGSYEYEFQGKKLILRDVAEKIVHWLSKFKDIGDIAVNFHPVHASLPWAGIRLLLQVFITSPV